MTLLFNDSLVNNVLCALRRQHSQSKIFSRDDLRVNFMKHNYAQTLHGVGSINIVSNRPYGKLFIV